MRNKMLGVTLTVTSLLITSFALSGCAQLKKEWAQMQANMAKQEAAQRAAQAKAAAAAKVRHCTTNGAYASGVNDGRTNKTMQMAYAEECTKTQRADLNKSYQQGYTTGMNARPIKQPHHHDSNKWQCIANNDSRNVCGYHCIKDNLGQVACGASSYDNCVKNNYGEMRCGYHCNVSPDQSISCSQPMLQH